MLPKRIHETSVQNSDIAYRIFREIALAPTTNVEKSINEN